MSNLELRKRLLIALEALGLAPTESGFLCRTLRSFGDARLTVSVAENENQIEFGLMEYQGDLAINLLHCTVSFDDHAPARIWLCDDAGLFSNCESVLASFEAPELQRALAVLREYVE